MYICTFYLYNCKERSLKHRTWKRTKTAHKIKQIGQYEIKRLLFKAYRFREENLRQLPMRQGIDIQNIKGTAKIKNQIQPINELLDWIVGSKELQKTKRHVNKHSTSLAIR